MKYLITGGCGFLGSNIASEILKNNINLIIYDNLSRLGAKDNLKMASSQGEIEFIKSDINDFENYLKWLKISTQCDLSFRRDK